MSIFPGVGEDNILAWRGVSSMVAEIAARKSERISHLSHREGLELLGLLRAGLADELAFEQEFDASLAETHRLLAATLSADQLAPLLATFDRLARQYFIRRGSVIALHDICSGYRDRLLERVLQHVAADLLRDGPGAPPGSWCLIAGGSTGRREQTFCCDPDWFLVHDDVPAADAAWFATFFERAMALAAQTGLDSEGGQKPVKRASRLYSRSGWRQEVCAGLLQDEPRLLVELVRRADLRQVCGDAALAQEAIGAVREVLRFREVPRGGRALRMLGKSVAEMPTGVDFFSRLRLERGGRNRGRFNLERFCLEPLLANIRMLSISCDLAETNTIARMKALQEQGCLNVELTERLLLAWHDFMVFKISRQLVQGCEKESEVFIDPPEPESKSDLRLRDGLEAVAALEKIAYLSFSDHG